jgi:hypothetical protein
MIACFWLGRSNFDDDQSALLPIPRNSELMARLCHPAILRKLAGLRRVRAELRRDLLCPGPGNEGERN